MQLPFMKKERNLNFFKQLASTLFFNTYVQHILYDEVDAASTLATTMGWGATEVKINVN